MPKWIKNTHKIFTYIGGNWAVPIGLVYFVFQNAKLGILSQIFSKSVSNWMYAMLTRFGLWLPYILGLIGVVWFGMSIWQAVLDFRRWRRKRAKRKLVKINQKRN